ncbi:MAG TPA: class 1 isoprenoid biosynthesis enzyme [Acidimicrobiia bacterium]|nr:class 1 isoprenoid biosynthesis enzyme [Acidimicrobiia bacterium]
MLFTLPTVYPPTLQRLAGESVVELFTDLAAVAPYTTERIQTWLKSLFGQVALEDVFMREDAYPLLLLPWWLEASVREPDSSLQRGLSTSSISGYLYIRLIDNLMDGDAPADVGLLPALSLFHTWFTEPFHQWFPPGHPFWEDFRNIWFDTAELTLRDSALPSINREQFETITARKTGAAKIPIAAVAHALGHPEQLADWNRLIDRFGCWHQMINDLFGWQKDLRNGLITYIQSEGRRLTNSPDSLQEWFFGPGFDWATAQLDAWMSEIQDLAVGIGSPDLLSYLEKRRLHLGERMAKVRLGLGALASLATVADLGETKDKPQAESAR